MSSMRSTLNSQDEEVAPSASAEAAAAVAASSSAQANTSTSASPSKPSTLGSTSKSRSRPTAAQKVPVSPSTLGHEFLTQMPDANSIENDLMKLLQDFSTSRLKTGLFRFYKLSLCILHT